MPKDRKEPEYALYCKQSEVDMEAHDGHRVPAKSADTMVADLALLLVLTTRALMA